MNATALVSPYAQRSVLVSGRGFRGGFKISSSAPSALLALGDAPGIVVRVVEFSPEHVIVESLPKRVQDLKSGTTARLRVRGFEELCFEVRAGIPNLRDRRGEVALDICEPTRELARALLARGQTLLRSELAMIEGQRAPTREILTAERLDEVLASLARNGFDGTVRIGEYAVASASLRSVSEDALEWQFEGPHVTGELTIEVPGYNSVFALDVTVVRCASGVLWTTRPATALRLRHRKMRRVRASEGLAVEFSHPLWPNVTVRREVREISAGGISFATSSDEDLLYPGLLLSKATLYAGERTMTFTGEVRSVTERVEQGREYCGMRVLPDSAKDEGTWQTLLDAHLYPRTRTGGSWAGATWDLYERAGYLNLSGKEAREFEDLRRAFHDVSDKLERAPHLGAQVVWVDEEENVEAAISIMKTYSTSWFPYQLAKVSGNTQKGVLGRKVLRDIHLHCFEHAQADATFKWVIAIPQVKPVWSRAVYYDLPARYVESGQAAVVRFRAMEIACDAAGSATGYEVGTASQDERARLLDEIARTRPAAYVQALDFTPERFDAAEICDDWAYAGLSRKRAVLVARRNGVAVAAAILESAQEGTHLFRLHDNVRLFPLAEGHEDAQSALLDAAREWFRAAGKTAYIAYLEHDMPLPASFQGSTRDLGLADFVVLAADLVPELLEHVVEVTAPREREVGAQ